VIGQADFAHCDKFSRVRRKICSKAEIFVMIPQVISSAVVELLKILCTQKTILQIDKLGGLFKLNIQIAVR
jgi:hypothetical protein